MKAIILAAGYATRLYPLTKNLAKPLLPICGKPIIDYLVDEINEIKDIDEIYVISNGVFYDQFENWKSNSNSKDKITVLNDNTFSNDTRLGAIGDISLCVDTYNIDDDTLVIAGDNLFDFKLIDVYNAFKKENKDCVCVKQIDDVELLKGFAVATVDDNDVIVDLIEKPLVPPSDIAVFATYMYKKDTVGLFKKYLDEGNNKDAPGYFVEYLYKIKEVYAYKFLGECIDIGTLDSYNSVKDSFKKD